MGIDGEVGNILAAWGDSRGKWETRVKDLLKEATLPGFTTPKPSFIWVGVGSTTSQAFYVINGGPPTAIKTDPKTGNTFGFFFGCKDGLGNDALVRQTERATDFLKLLSDERKKIAKENDLTPNDLPIFFAKSIAFALKKNPYGDFTKKNPFGDFKNDKGRIASLGDPKLAMPPNKYPDGEFVTDEGNEIHAHSGLGMSPSTFKKTPESVLSAKALHRAFLRIPHPKMYLLRCGFVDRKAIKPPADFLHPLIDSNKVAEGDTVVDIGGGSISAQIKEKGKNVKGEFEQGKDTSNGLYNNGEGTPETVAKTLLKHIAALENENKKTKTKTKLSDPALGMDLAKTEVLQTGKMRKDFYSKARRARYDDYADYGYDENYADYEEYADYAMYEEAMDNLNRAQMEFDIAQELLERAQIDRT